ncbi:sugar ABC transporter ATP-binding protein [Marinomonas sp. S3726]|uniref:sugar ABC transporter ATP-binding protein n=1 Tax=Marinomonas sp. S3726 TaxID=579484 RepID=UPI0005FA8EEB|nr:sugar ABC transporter ATP-binding protein [Marinomonas sp. S3726]
MTNSDSILEMINVSKTFPGVKALDQVNLTIRKGSIHALMGENGAGKSTLMKILYGLYTPDEGGEILFDGQPFTPKVPIDAIRTGLAMVPQEISPSGNLSVAANFFLGRELRKGFLMDHQAMNKETAKVLDELGIPMEVETLMQDVSVAKAQLLAIATAVSYDAKLIIMDEPTTALTESEVQQLYKIVRKVQERGISIIYISHKLGEVFELSDEVSVIRDGEYIGTKQTSDITKEELINMMVGREMDEMFERERVEIGETLLEVNNLSLPGKFEDISFDVKKGEVFGIAGLVGAGRSEVVEAIFGYKAAQSGDIYLHGKRVEIYKPMDAIKRRIGFVTEDRKLTGLMLNMSVTDNMIMPELSPYVKSGLISDELASHVAEDMKKQLRIKTPTVDTIIDNLSGGNQQKVLIARWLLLEPEVLILDEPTKGIDVGAKAEIYKLIVELARLGKAIIIVSSEMLELLSLSDRIMVMAEGREIGIVDREQATQEVILEMAAGGDVPSEQTIDTSDLRIEGVA